MFYLLKDLFGGYKNYQKIFCRIILNVTFVVVQSPSHVRLFATPWTVAHQASLSLTNSRSLSKFMSIESVMPSNHFILCRPLLLLPSVFPSVNIFSNESVLHIRWPKYIGASASALVLQKSTLQRENI